MTYEEIASLGNLVNIHVSEIESRDLIPKLDSVLGYIDQIQNVSIPEVSSKQFSKEAYLRDDVHIDANFGDDFIQLVPEKENGYMKVTKVLGGE